MPQLEHSSSQRLKQLTVSASTTCADSLFQLSTTHWLKKNFLTFRRLLSLNSLYPWPLRLCRPSLRVKNFALSIDSLPDRILYVSIRSPRSLFFSSVVRSNRWRRSLYVKCLNSGTSFEVLIWIPSRVLMSFLKWGHSTRDVAAQMSCRVSWMLEYCHGNVVL